MVVDLVDVMHQIMMVEMVIIIPHHILVLVVVLLIMDLVEVVTKVVVVLQAFPTQGVVAVVHRVVDQTLAVVLVVMVEKVIKLHGFLLTYQLCSVNQDRHQECGTAVVVEVVQDQVQMEDLVEIIQQ